MKCSASLAFYSISPTHLINLIKHEHSCKILFLKYCVSQSYPCTLDSSYNLWMFKVCAFVHACMCECVSVCVLPTVNNDINRGSYMSAHFLLNLLNKLRKKIKCEACRAFYPFFATSLINSIIQEHEC